MFVKAVVYDLILVGGGLANGLVALFLKHFRPEVRFLLIEQGRELGGNHTWSFHHSDLTRLPCLRNLPNLEKWVLQILSPLIAKTWDSYTVLFPGYSRTLSGKYHSISSEKFHEYLSRELEGYLHLGIRVISISSDQVILEGGETFKAKAILDGRGFREGSWSAHSSVGLAAEAAATPLIKVGFQKFVGLEVTLEQPHELKAPILMDVSLPQSIEGYRFFYSLPWSETRVLIEDTYYSNSSELKAPEIKEGILRYAENKGWRIKKIDRIEAGVLPIPLGGDWKDWVVSQEEEGPLPCSGVRAGLFQAVTGYSFSYALGFALSLCNLPSFDGVSLLEFTQRYSESAWKKNKFFRLLNRMMFLASEPEERYRIFEGFYRHSEGLVERFYSGNLSRIDYARFFLMKPPVKIYRAIQAVRECN